MLALGLTLLALGLCYYKTTRLGLPLIPSEQTEVWSVEARIQFKADPGPVKVSFYIPSDPPGFTVINEDFVSSNYGLTMEDDGVNRKVIWAVRRATGDQVLYYRIQLVEDPNANAQHPAPKPRFPTVPEYREPARSAVMSFLERVRRESADVETFVRELLKQINDPTPHEDVQLLFGDIHDPAKRVRKIIEVLAGARIPSRIVYTLKLQSGLRHGTLEPWLETHNGQRWLAFNPTTGDSGFPSNVLVWRVGEEPLIELKRGHSPKVEISAARSEWATIAVAERRAQQIGSHLMAFSLYSLPIQTQNVYRILLMVPLGAFLIVLLRNLIGIKTFGTFMPILIALAFRETQLVWGLVLFSSVVALGLLLRFYLETLKLLLVPRLAAVLIIVIILMAFISLITHKLGLDKGLSVALFPMVILTMTIERMSLIWEEAGAAEALTQGIGSLFAASLGYLFMSSALLNHLIFMFPELLLLLLALVLLIGRYTGYRVSELWRFRALWRSGADS